MLVKITAAAVTLAGPVTVEIVVTVTAAVTVAVTVPVTVAAPGVGQDSSCSCQPFRHWGPVSGSQGTPQG